ncbi:universal stress protein [Streptomyces sp. GS7]|uniref:universal stress protein n=1 Tax=Streptomyces sp. GS7 TaxID=2692234 RepID=UPI001317864B|nr:universal stress protein [Streptomyces sp. GS7]QHC23000.1 universal stress protein [Streptomyces sp. GS7]
MSRPVAVGVDGSPASLAAADWGAREAVLRDLPLRLLHAWERQPHSHAPPAGPEAARRWSQGGPQELTDRLRQLHPDLDITADFVVGPPRDVLCQAAKDAEMLVIGTVGAGRLTGFLLGSVSMATVAHAEAPVVLVRAGRSVEQPPPGAEPGPPLPVVLGLDLSRPCNEVIGFAFETAAVRAAPLVVVHGWNPPPYHLYGLGAALRFGSDLSAGERDSVRQALRPWQERYPGVELAAQAVIGEPAHHLLDAATHAALVVIGRHRRTARPAPSHIGHIAHAVLHHCLAPVAVVPHG